jgi:hypothetical protein
LRYAAPVRALIAFCAGLCLMALRVPLGVDLFELPAVDPVRAYRARALGFVVVFLAVSLAPRRFDRRQGGADLLCGAALGVLVGGLGAPYPRVAFELARLALPLRGLPKPDYPRTSPRVVLGCVAAGAGAALSLEGLARHVRRLALDTPGDDAVFAACLALCLALGGVAFGRVLAPQGEPPPRRAGARLGLALIASALCVHIGMAATRGLVTPRGLRAFVRRFGSDLSLSGTLGFDALVGGALFLVPAFGVGAAVYLARRRGELAALLAGAAIGLALVPVLLADAPASGRSSADLVRYGEWALLAGGALVAARVRGAWLVASGALALAGAAAALLVDARFLPVPKAWERFPREPLAVCETAAGQVWLDTLGASLDQRPLATDAAAAWLPLSLELVGGRELWVVGAPSAAWERSGARPVFVNAWAAPAGDLTPPAAASLLAGRTVAAARRAWTRAEQGRGALVVVPPVAGGAPLVPRHVDPPPGSAAVAWFDAGTPVAQSRIGAPIVIASDGLLDLSIGVIFGLAGSVDEGQLLAAGAPAPRRWPLADLLVREERRPDLWRARMCRRIARANPQPGPRAFFEALAEHYDAQRPSSPFESRAEQVELDDATLAKLRDAALEIGGGYAARLWWGVSRTLVEKRAVTFIYAHIEPLARAWPDANWPLVALAVADLESLEPARARDRLASVTGPESRAQYSEVRALAHAQLGEHEAAARAWRGVPGPRGERGLALSLLRAGDDEGRGLARALLRADPADAELRRALNGDFDPPPRGYPAPAPGR